MREYLWALPDINLFILLASLCVILSIVFVFIVRIFIPYHIRSKDNAVIGNISALIGIIYGVLAGLSALYLINNISYATDAVQREANALADIYRDSKLLKNPTRDHVQTEIKNYINRVIKIEWPLMEGGKKIDSQGDFIIEKMVNELVLYQKNNQTESFLLNDMLQGIKSFYDARQQRIEMSYVELNPDLWAVLLLGTILTLFINYLFAMNFYLHIITVSAAALMTASMLFLLVALDRPFQGDFIVEPSAFKDVLILMDKNNS